ncbi:MAG: nickel-responsive transcriptional regulator NikR [Betaproteobacteria bacterium]|nr:MAG: nickel-responsive transcriptional regulator NikR [Betaproteobacteria bacterium]
MERFTISLSDDLANQFDSLLRKRGYQNRSEAVRDMLRSELANASIASQEAPYCIAALSYIYNHKARDLSERIAQLQHANHDIVISTMHIRVDHENCLETVLLKGSTADITQFANTLMAESEVRHGHLNRVPVEMDEGHVHEGRFEARHHVHAHPRN